MSLRLTRQQVLERFRERVALRAPGNMRLSLRISGGLPEENLDHSVVIDGSGEVAVDIEDAREPQRTVHRRERLDAGAVVELLADLEGRLHVLAAEGDARFVPDSLIGRATIEIDGKIVRLLFSPDETALPTVRDVATETVNTLARKTILAARWPIGQDDEA